jgi:hypothetical protein
MAKTKFPIPLRDVEVYRIPDEMQRDLIRSVKCSNVERLRKLVAKLPRRRRVGKPAGVVTQNGEIERELLRHAPATYRWRFEAVRAVIALGLYDSERVAAVAKRMRGRY